MYSRQLKKKEATFFRYYLYKKKVEKEQMPEAIQEMVGEVIEKERLSMSQIRTIDTAYVSTSKTLSVSIKYCKYDPEALAKMDIEDAIRSVVELMGYTGEIASIDYKIEQAFSGWVVSIHDEEYDRIVEDKGELSGRIYQNNLTKKARTVLGFDLEWVMV